VVTPLRTIGLLILSLPVAIGPGRASGATQARNLASAYLVGRMGFDERNMKTIESGRPVARTVDGRAAEDIGVVGAIRIQAPPTALLARLRDIVAFEKSPSVLQIGLFGATPSLNDVKGLTLDADDLSALQSCTPGACDLQLPDSVIKRFQSEVNWRAPKSAETATAMMRQHLVDLVTAYRSSGNDGLGRYDDDRPGVHVAEEFRLLGFAYDLPAPLPALASYLTDYPRAPLRGAEEFFYWSKVEFGLKPTIRVNHLTIYPTSDRRDGLRYVAATKQLYASHYFSTALELRFLLSDPARPDDGFILLLVTKSRIRGLSGLVGGTIRLVVKGRAARSMERHLEHTKKRAEGIVPRIVENSGESARSICPEFSTIRGTTPYRSASSKSSR
jgi:hypothetical protein